MRIEEFINYLGFTKGNPFQYTNADQEYSSISDYFISPDYFEDLWGDPKLPISNIILAPRGTGKTAQRIMIEKRAMQENVLAITYTSHDLSAFNNLDKVDINYHFELLNRLILIGLYTKIFELSKEKFETNFTFEERQFLFMLAKLYLYKTPSSFPTQAISSLKTIPDRALDVWKSFSEPVSKIIQNITKSQGFEVDISKIKVDDYNYKMSHKDNLKNLIDLSKKLNFTSIYILVDKVDEQDKTGNDPSQSFKLISPLLKDLEVLEMKGLAFKFFLWDALSNDISKYSRPDRVPVYELEWSTDELKKLLNKRVQYFSENKIENISTIFETEEDFNMVLTFGERSPRDCIRILSRAITEQNKLNDKVKYISKEALHEGIEHFIKQKTSELIPNPNSITHLKKVGSVTFTIEGLVSKKVGSGASAVRNIINPWTKFNLAKKIGIESKSKVSRSVNLYSYIDSRIARTANPQINIEDFYKQKVKHCSSCSFTYYRDFEIKKWECPNCDSLN
ncbi:P-loop ATPase, Sll1717 family [Leptospira kanakyensis]|uniref:P-loop ATPase, Sll1717 family n=1 Tax=Leptospira kanakyensis TaxID=2484968 RepID=UPI00223DEEC8|nr:hypothetical protein [Leptospira kanakyensis]MCW7471716.1 hypothetical protein [Leptospira kanakyensis]